MKVVVLGGTGFVGTWLLRALRSRGIDAWPTPDDRPIDIRDESALTQVLATDPQVVINLAAIASPALAAREPLLAEAVNHVAAVRLARLMAQRGTGTLIHVGSALAYGDTFRTTQPVSERHPMRPVGVYARTKAKADLAIGSEDEASRVTLRLRPFWHTGPGQDPQYVVASFARQVAGVMLGQQEPVIRVGNLDVQRDFLDVRDVAEIYADLATRADALAGSLYNVASGRAVSIRQLLDGLIARAGRRIDVEIDPARLRPDEVMCAVGDTSLLRADLSWTPRFDIDRMLDDILEDWLKRLRPGRKSDAYATAY